MKNWTVYFTQPGYDSKLVYDGPAESFKEAIRLSGLYHRTIVDESKVERTSFTYGINGSTFSTKPKMFLVVKAGQYEGMHPLLNKPAVFTFHRDVAVWDGFANDLKDATEQAKTPNANHKPPCSMLNCNPTYALVDRETYYSLYCMRDLDCCAISVKK